MVARAPTPPPGSLRQVISLGHKENVTLQQATSHLPFFTLRAAPAARLALLARRQIPTAAHTMPCAVPAAARLRLEPLAGTQVRTYTEMESHEEKLHKMIIQSKINDTKDVMKRKAAEIEKSKVERKAHHPACVTPPRVQRATSPCHALSTQCQPNPCP